ncbi:MAG: PQQ-dependent sugar dehydrogenase [Opitutales bacterium]
MNRYPRISCLLLALSNALCTIVVNGDPGRALYTQWCSSCHGVNHEGGLGGSLTQAEFKQVGKTKGFLAFVKEGNLELGMPPFGAALNDEEILSIAHYIAASRKKGPQPAEVEATAEAQVGTGEHDFEMEEVFPVEGLPWSIAFLPDELAGFITVRGGDDPKLLMFRDDEITGEVQGLPEVFRVGQGGLLEVALHPNYSSNGWIYLAYSHQKGGEKDGMTRVIRGKLDGNRWTSQEIIYEAPTDTYRNSSLHWGVRIVFKGGYIYFGIGDRGKPEDAQDLSKPNGKIHRLNDDGRIPRDNPFVNDRDALPTIWAFGIRNPQGMDLHPLTGEIWESEHGPKGGDEINLIEKGKNYGWPEITFGVNYNGTPISDKTSAPGMEQPKLHWTPSIAVCGIDFYEGDVFPNWKYNLFVTSLARQEFHRLIIQNGEVADSELLFQGKGRIRDVASGPDGNIYIIFNGPGKVVRLVPN